MSNPQGQPPVHAEPVKRLVLKINKTSVTPSAAPNVIPSAAPQPQGNPAHVPSVNQTPVPNVPVNATPSVTTHTVPSVNRPPVTTTGPGVAASTVPSVTPNAPHVNLTPAPSATLNPTQSSHVPVTLHVPSEVTPVTRAPVTLHVPSTHATQPHHEVTPATRTPLPTPHVPASESTVSDAHASGANPKPVSLTVTSGGRTITIKPLAKPGTAPTPSPTAPTTPTVTPVNPPPVTSPPVARPKFVLKTKLTLKLPRKLCVEEVTKLKQAETPKPALKLKIAFPAKDESASVTPSAASRKRKALYDLSEESHDDDVETPRRKRSRLDLEEPSEEPEAESESEVNAPKLPLSEVMRALLPELTARDANEYYRHEITEDVAPSYFEIIKQPMWFNKMAEKLANNEYPTLVSFQRDFELICENAMKYNRASTPWHKEARKLLREGKQLIERWTKRLEPNDLALHLDAVKAAALISTKRERDRDSESEPVHVTDRRGSAQSEVGRVSDLVKRKFAGSQSVAPPVSQSTAEPSGAMLPPRSSLTSAHLFQATRQIKSPYPSAMSAALSGPGVNYPPGLHSRAAHATNPAAHQYSPLITTKASHTFLSPYVPNFVAFTSTTPATPTHIVAPQIIKLPINDVSYTASLEHFVHTLDHTAQARVRKFIQELRTGPTAIPTPHGEAQSGPRPVLTTNTLGTTPAELKSALQTAAQLGLDMTALTGLVSRLDGDVPSHVPTANPAAVARKETLLSASQSALVKLQAMHEARGGDVSLVSPAEQQLVRTVSDNLTAVMEDSAVSMTE